MTKFKLTEKLQHIINTSDESNKRKKELTSKDIITHIDLITFYKQYRPTTTLLELLSVTELVCDNKNVSEPKPKSEEYLKLMERLKLEAKENEYKSLITPKPEFNSLYEDKLTDDDEKTPAQLTKEVKSHLTTIINVLISVASVSYAIWYWTETSWKLPTSYRVLMSLFFGFLVLVAEVVVYLGYLNKIEDARHRERSKKEVKKVVKTI